MTFSYLLLSLAVILAAAGQVLLKKGAGSGGLNLVILRLNIWVVLGLFGMVLSMLLNLKALFIVPLRDMAFILPTVYIMVPLFSRLFLKEELNSRIIIGTAILILGIVLFNIPVIRLF